MAYQAMLTAILPHPGCTLKGGRSGVRSALDHQVRGLWWNPMRYAEGATRTQATLTPRSSHQVMHHPRPLRPPGSIAGSLADSAHSVTHRAGFREAAGTFGPAAVVPRRRMMDYRLLTRGAKGW
jgi:hypothetical protein